MRSYYFGIRRYAARHNDKFILTGWVPAREEQAFCRRLDQVDAIEYSVETPERDHRHSPPVELRNRRPVPVPSNTWWGCTARRNIPKWIPRFL